jgi:hypothetical protein
MGTMKAGQRTTTIQRKTISFLPSVNVGSALCAFFEEDAKGDRGIVTRVTFPGGEIWSAAITAEAPRRRAGRETINAKR